MNGSKGRRDGGVLTRKGQVSVDQKRERVSRIRQQLEAEAEVVALIIMRLVLSHEPCGIKGYHP